MIRNTLGLPARSLMVAAAAACWLPFAAVPDALHGQAVPGAPTNLRVTGKSPTSIELTWDAPTSDGGSAVTGYRIERSTNLSTGWDTIERDTGLTLSYQDNARDPGTTRYYRVAAINNVGTGAPSNVVEGTTPMSTRCTGSDNAGAPCNLTADAAGPTIIDLDWDVPSSIPSGKTISGYQVDVSANLGVNFTFLARTTATEHQHTGLTAGATRHYQVRALYSDNTLGRPAYAQATTVATGIPGVPQNLTATAAGPSVIELDWDAPASDGGNAITHYEVRVSADAGVSWGTPLTAAQSSYQHTGLPAGETRHYQVRARNANGPGPWTSAVNATTSTGTPPGPPRSLTATAAGSSAIELSWSAPVNPGSSAITGYRIEWSSTRTGAWSDLEANTGSTRTTYRDTGLSPNTSRYYRVSAINSFGTGTPSNIAGDITALRVPDAPGQLTAEARGRSAIELDWTRPASSGTSPVTGYQIQWSSTGRSGWRSLETNTRSTTTRYTDTGLSPGTTRYYRVAAISAAGTSAWSNIADATTDDLTVPGVPTGLRATPDGLKGSTQIRLTWSAPSNDGGSSITGYRIERAITRGGPWIIQVASTGSTATTYLHTGLVPNTTRFYRVRALNAQGSGEPSNVAEGETNAARPGQPRNLRARATGPTSITLAWQAPTSDGGERITGYTIRERVPNGTWITIVPNTGSTATTFERTGLQPATAYQYQVAAINRVGAGQWSFETSTSTYAQAPGAPVGLTARAVGTSRIDLSWSTPRNTGGAEILGYRIEASDDERKTWRIIRRNTSSKGTTFSDVNLEPATRRYYRVAAINTAGTGPYSNFTSATTEATVPGTPRGLDAEADGTSRIELSWRAPTSDGGTRITGYRIEVSEDGGTRWNDLVTNSHNTRTTYVHTGLEPATRRHYRVSAINREGVGRASRVVSAVTDATVPDAPTGLVATAVSPTQIDLFWAAPAYDGGATVTGYRVEVSEDGAAWTDLMVNTGSRATAYSHTGLQPGSARHYRVSAINRVGAGAASVSASAQTDDPIGRAGRLNTRVLPHVASAMTSSTVSAIARRVDAVASGMGMQRRVETNGLSSMAASLSSPEAGGLGLAQGDQAGLAALFGGTSFTMPFGASDTPQQQSATGTQLASWGAGEYHYLGEPGQSTLDWKGNMVSAHAGIDARIGPDILAGVAGSYSSGSFDFTDKTGASPVRGTYGTTMTSVHPYMAWFSGGGVASVWGSAGLGRGDIDVDDEREGFRTSPASLLTGAGGASYQLLTRGAGGVRLKAEGWYGEVTVDGNAQIEEVTLEMQRGKVALELTQGFSTDNGSETALVLEGGMRYDDGDGVNGASAEVGGGLRYTNSNLGLTAEGRGRFVISARDGYEEWGIGGTVMFDPATRGDGLSIRVAPSYGNHLSGVNQLWERGVTDAVGGYGLGMGPNVDGEVAYGIAGFQGTPYSGFYLGQGGTRAVSSGVRYDLGSGVGLRLEGTRRESGLGGAQHSVGVRGRIKFR